MSDRTFPTVSARATPRRRTRSAALRRALVVVLAVACLIAGLSLTGRHAEALAVGRADPGLVRVLRAMAVLKLSFVLGATAGILWRFGAAARPFWLAAYAAAIVAMWSGPGLIWTMAHVRAGALLMHGGLAATVLLLWRDRIVGERLDLLIARRRAAIRARG